MSVLSREEMMNRIRERMGEDTSDETLAFIEDVSDTLADLDRRATDTTNWEQKYKENDDAWRQRYRDRFYSSEPVPEPENLEPETPQGKITYESLFK